MGFKIERKPFKIGSSYAVTLPPAWLAFYGDRAKTVTMVGNTVLILAPKGLEDQAQRLISELEEARE